MSIDKIYDVDSFGMADILVAQDHWKQYKTVNIPQARELLKGIADCIDKVYVDGKAKDLKKNEIATIIQDTFVGMDKRTVSKARTYSQNFDAIMVHLAQVGSLSVSIDRMVQNWQTVENKIVKENNSGLKAWIKTTYEVPTPKEEDQDSYPLNEIKETGLGVKAVKIKTGYEGTTKPVTMDDHFMVMGRFLFTVNQYVDNNSYTTEQEIKIIESFSEVVGRLAEKHTLRKVA